MFKWKKDVSMRLDFISSDILRLEDKIHRVLRMLEDHLWTFKLSEKDVNDAYKKALTSMRGRK